MYKGIFWIIRDLLGDRKLLSVKVACDFYGQPLEHVCFSSKSGDNFNHRLEWSKLSSRLTQGKSFNYYPRGRVEVRNGKITVFCHPVFTQSLYRKWIIREFAIPDNSRFVADGSAHYKAKENLE